MNYTKKELKDLACSGFCTQDLSDFAHQDMVDLAHFLDRARRHIEAELDRRQEHFTVAIFGSARVEEGTALYEQIEELAFRIGQLGARVVTGGGPGIMQAANQGVKRARPDTLSSLGVNIKLPKEQILNPYVDWSDSQEMFSSRLDEFIRLSQMFVIAPGGLGTLLELAFLWQLKQVDMMQSKKIVLYKASDHWAGLLNWVRSTIITNGYAEEADVDLLIPTQSNDQIITIAREEMQRFTQKKGA